MAKYTLIIQTGDSFDELVSKNMNFQQLIINKIGNLDCKVVRVFKEEKLPDYCDIDRVIISGSHSMVTDEDNWLSTLSQWLIGIEKLNIPVLGICFGHQLLAKIFGGVSHYHPKGPEIGMTNIHLTKAGQADDLFKGLETTFNGYVTHSQSAIKLPNDAILLAYNDFEPHQSFKLGNCIYGVQFHPEFTANIIKSYIENQKEKVTEFQKVYDDVVEIESGVKIFKNFMNL